MANLINTNGFVTNPQFSGGEAIIPLSGSDFAYANEGYGGLYVGTAGTLVVKTINGNVLTLVSASGFIPGLIGAVSASSTAANIIGFDKKPVAPPTTTTSTSTTAAPTTSTTTAAVVLYPFALGFNGGSPTTACNNANNGTTVTVYATAAALAPGVILYNNSDGTSPREVGIYTLGAGQPQWAVFSNGTINSSLGTCPALTTSTTAAPTTSTTTEAGTTSTTTAAAQFTAITLYSGSYTGTPGSATITGPGSVYFNSAGGGFPGPVSVTLYITSSITAWGPAGPASIQAYTDSGLTTLYTGGAEADFNAWGAPLTFPIAGGGAVRFFDLASDAFTNAQV